MSDAVTVVTRLYDLVSFPAGSTPDWEAVRGLFLPEAVVVLRTSREASTVFSLDGFVQDFEAFIERADARASGFTEHLEATHVVVHGDLAHVLALYRPELPGSNRAPRRGVDSIQLARREGGWRIVSIVNELVTDEHPVPDVLAG